MVQKLINMPNEDITKTRKINSMRLSKSFELYEEKCNQNRSIPDHVEDADPLALSIIHLITPVQNAEYIRLRKEEREAKEAAAAATLMQARNAKINEESKRFSEENAHRTLKLRVKNAIMRNILSAAEERLSGSFNIWKMAVREMKLIELQELMDSRRRHLHEEESRQSPFFLAKAAFELSEKYRRRRGEVVAEVNKKVHRFGIGTNDKVSDDARRLRYQIPNHLERYEVHADGTPSAVEKALLAARRAFEYSEDRRDERTLDEESLKRKKEERLRLIDHHVKGVCVENKSALTDEEKHSDLCYSIKSDLKLDSDGEEEMYRSLISFSPENPFSRALYGAYLYKKGDMKGAKQEFEKAIAVIEANGGVHADSHYYCGAIMVTEEKYVDAETHFKTALKSNAYHADCLCAYGTFLFDVKGKLEMAEVRLKECLEVNPKHLNCLKTYARLMKNMDESKNPDKWEDTCDLLAQIISLCPDDVETLLQYALLVQKKLNLPENAKKAYEMLLEIDPSNQEALIQYSYMLFKQLPPVSNKFELPKKIIDVINQIRVQLAALRTIDDVKEEYISTANTIEEKLEQYYSAIANTQNMDESDMDTACLLCSVS